MNKKHVAWMILIIVITIFVLVGIRLLQNDSTKENKFQVEYERLNGTKNSQGTEYLSISISENNKMYYASYQEIMDLLDHGTGVIYFGFPECPWCRSAVPVLLEAVDETSIDKVYYFNAYDIRDQKKLDENGQIIVEKEGTEEYKNLVNKLDSVLNPYEGLNDSTIKRLYFPTVLFVKNGEILYMHEGTLDSQKDPYVALTTLQQAELRNVYLTAIHDVLGDLCAQKC